MSATCIYSDDGLFGVYVNSSGIHLGGNASGYHRNMVSDVTVGDRTAGAMPALASLSLMI